MRRSIAILAAATLIAGCQAAQPSSLATTSPAASPVTTPTAAASGGGPSGTPPPSPSANPGDRWEPTGTMATARVGPHAVLLDDGRVLVVGNDTLGAGLRDDAATAELYDPATGAWTPAASLNKPRGEPALVRLADGRVLVIGGANQGPDGCESDSTLRQSFSSGYLYDPLADGWDRTGLLATARTAPAVAALPDGRVLVAGGYFRIAPSTGSTRGGRISLALARPFLDVIPDTMGRALATAEIFDPTTGEWSKTGPMRYARYGVNAVTLADGRVLIAGSGPGAEDGVGSLDADAPVTAEIFDPATGRFTLTGRLPGLDRAALEAAGFPLPDFEPQAYGAGTLVALPDGGAVLIGTSGWWKHQGDVTRSFRLDAATRDWREIGQTWISVWDDESGTGTVHTSPGDRRLDAMAVALADGRVLVAGGYGQLQAQGATLGSAELYDPVTDTWTPTAPMPEPRAAGAAVLLADGSVLLAGGYNDSAEPGGGCARVGGLRSAVRYVPGR